MAQLSPVIDMLLLALLACSEPEDTVVGPPTEVYTWKGKASGEFPGGLTVHHYELGNGLELLVLPDDSAPVVAWQTWYGVGSSDEVAGKTGLAHLFEHLMFKATEDYGPTDFDSRLSALGARGINAWTWLDETVYTQQVPAGALRELAELERSRMTRLKVNAEQLDAEREVVINERRLRVDNDPEGKLNELLYQAAFDSSPYGWPTIGWQVDLDALTVEDAQAFYERWYAPDNATVILAGDVDPGEAVKLMGEVFGALPASGVSGAALPEEPPQAAPRRVEATLEVSNDRLQVGFKIPRGDHPDAAALKVLQVALTEGRSAPVVRALEDTGLAASVGSFLEGMQEPGLLEITVTAGEGVSAEQLEAALFSELRRLKDEGLIAADLERGRSQLKANMLRELEGNAGKASFLGWYAVTHGDWRGGPAMLAAVDAVSLADLERVLATYLTSERSTVAVGRASGASGGTVSARARTPLSSGPALEARPPAGAPSLERGAVTEAEVAGARLVTVYDPAAQVLTLRMGWPAGAAAAPSGVATLTAKMLLRGTERRSRAAFEASVEQLGATLDINADVDHAILTATVPADNWPRFYALLSEALSAPSFAPAELKKLSLEVANRALLQRDNDSALVERAFAQARYGADHPYGRDPLGTPAALAAITPAQLRAFHGAFYVSEGAVVGLSGAFDAGARADLEALIRALGGPAPARAAVPPAPAIARRVVVVDKPERSQVQLRIAVPGVEPGGQHWPAFYLGTQVVGGFQDTAWLYDRVRIQRGWSYFAYGQNRHKEADDTWVAWLAPGTEQAAGAAALVRESMIEAAAEGISAEALEQVRDTAVNGAPFLYDTASRRMGLRFSFHLTGVDDLALIEALPDVALAQVNEALGEVLAPEAGALIVAVATAAEVDLSALGPVEVVSYEAVE